MFAVIGVGGAGGNIANYASKNGILAGAINLSEADLSSLEHIDLKLKLNGSEGAGHNRDEAIRLIEKNMESVIKFFEDNFTNPSIDVVLVPFGTSGGTGSGVSPLLLDVLSNMFDKTFVALPIIPDKSEVIANQVNCIRAFEELSSLNVSVFPIDNEKFKDKGKNTMYRYTNESVINLFMKILDYTGRQSQNGIIDKRDLLTILQTKGIGNISELEMYKDNENAVCLTEFGLTKMIQNSWNDNSIFSNIEHEQILRAGIIFDGNESSSDFLNHAKLFSIFNNMPIDLFEGNYRSGGVNVISILTGLSWCKTRLVEIENIVDENKNKIENALSNDNTYSSRMSSMNSVIRKPVDNKKKSFSDILSRYKR